VQRAQVNLTPGGGMAKFIDHTLLKPSAKLSDIRKLCSQAKKAGFYSVCVNPCHVALCKKILKKSRVKVSSVCGFPLGANSINAKVFEASESIRNGADEIDAVMNIGLFKSGEYGYINKEFRALRSACRGKTLKIIIEACLLSDREKAAAARLAERAGADFVKTSTGFSSGGAVVRDIELLRKTLGPKTAIKASGGIRTYGDAARLIAAGASRLGTSSSLEIIAREKTGRDLS